MNQIGVEIPRSSRRATKLLAAAAALGIGVTGLMAASGQAALGLGPGEGDPRLENVSGRCITGTAFEIRGDVQGQGTDLTLIANATDGEVNVRVGPDVPMNAGFGFMYQGDIGALPQPLFIELLLISADESTVFDQSLPTIDWSQCETNEPETNEPEANEPETDEPEADEPETNEPETNEPETNEPEANEPETNERPTLPATGSSSSTWITLIAGLALIGGTALIAATRRRA